MLLLKWWIFCDIFTRGRSPLCLFALAAAHRSIQETSLILMVCSLSLFPCRPRYIYPVWLTRAIERSALFALNAILLSIYIDYTLFTQSNSISSRRGVCLYTRHKIKSRARETAGVRAACIYICTHLVVISLAGIISSFFSARQSGRNKKQWRLHSVIRNRFWSPSFRVCARCSPICLLLGARWRKAMNYARRPSPFFSTEQRSCQRKRGYT
jgi:hypothetical protein